jgi:predicted ATPase/class 3 adenylate cyclase
VSTHDHASRNLIPHFILNQYARGRFQGRFRAASLFTDISGFTALSEMLMQHGRDGAEVLTDTLNAVFTPLVEAVYANGGFIGTFAGDAFTAFFPVRRRSAVLYATRAAFAIQEFFEDHGALHTRYGDLDLGAKCGLGFGPVHWGILGRGNRHAYFFRGEAVAACARAEGRARKGDIVAAPVMRELLGLRVQGAPVGDCFRLTSHGLGLPPKATRIAPISRAALRPFVHEAVIDLRAPAEFRDVASAFISFEEPRDDRAFNAFVADTLDLAASYDGYFNRLNFGAAGGMILVLFGAPVAYENNLERAADFLSALRPKLNCRAGLSFGTAYAGFLGGAGRAEYTAIGDIVNLSARLATSAPWGETWASSVATKWLSARGYRLEPVGTFTFKGKSQAITVSRLAGRPRTAVQTVPFRNVLIGRDDEIARLAAWLQPIFEGSFAGLVYVHGEAGVGKSHLAYGLQTQLSETHQLGWFVCPADGILRQSLNPFKHFLRRYFDQSPDRSIGENESRFHTVLNALIAQSPPELAEEIERTRSVLGALVDLYWTGSLYDQLEPKFRRENSLTAFKSLVLAESLRQPLVLHIEDPQWLDEDSVELIGLLTRNVERYPFAVLLSGRYRDDGSRVAVETDPDVPQHTLDLKVLPAVSVRALAEHVLGGEIGQDLTTYLSDKTNGNPFFVEQLSLDLQERGALERDAGGAWKLPLRDAVEVPASINAVLIARVDRLATQVKDTVQTAAVLGREFEIDVLSRMLKDDPEVLTIVKQAEAEAIWSVLTEIRYIFRHALLRDAAYDMQLRARLRGLHALAGAAIEDVYAGDLKPHYADLAYHYRKAEAADRERIYARLAGEQALAVSSFREALELLQRTLELVQEAAGPDTMALLKLIGDVHFNLGSYPLAQEYFEKSLSLAEQLRETPAAARARQGLGSIASHRGDYVTARECFERNLEAYREIGDQRGIADSLRHLGHTIQHQGNHAEAQRYYEQSLRIHREINDQKGISASFNSLGDAVYRQGDYATAAAHWEQTLKISRKLNDRLGGATALNNLGNATAELGDDTKAQAYYEESLEIRREIGDREGMAASLNNLAYLPYTQGDYEAAKRFVQRSLEVAREIGRPHIIAMNLNNLGMFADLQGDYDEARAYYEEGLGLARRTGDRWNVAHTLCGLGSTELKLGATERAERSYREVLQIARDTDAPSLALEALAGMARLHTIRGQPVRGAELLGLAAQHPATPADVRQTVLAPLRASLETALAQDELAAALDRGGCLDLEKVVAETLTGGAAPAPAPDG